MGVESVAFCSASVALHPEGVDRNPLNRLVYMAWRFVALHPEGVDRNSAIATQQVNPPVVALHPEGVDRNPGTMPVVDGDIGRPPPGGRG